MTDALKPCPKTQTALALMNSMILSGEEHSEISLAALDAAKNELAGLSDTRSDLQPRVKELEWEVVTKNGEEGYLFSGPYEISPSGANLWIHRIENGDIVEIPDWVRPLSGPASGDQEPAKAAAQADYERRILSALGLAPVTPAQAAEVSAEYVAFRMWREEVRDMSSGLIAGRQSIENFREQHEEVQNKWLNFAAAALKAIKEGE